MVDSEKQMVFFYFQMLTECNPKTVANLLPDWLKPLPVRGRNMLYREIANDRQMRILLGSIRE